MKTLRYFFLLLPIITLFSCAKDESGPQVLKISDKSLHFSGKGGAWQITVNSNCDWDISGTNAWCTTNVSSGSKTGGFIVTVDSNATDQPRTANLVLTYNQSQAVLSILQDTTTGELHYELPVIFHILYSDEKDSIQRVDANVITRMIAECNDIYKNNLQSVDMNMKLVAATQTPDGKPLEEEGIQRIFRSNANQISCNTFMDKNKADASLMWNPNQYINVFIYTFTETNTLGISHIPFTPRANSLPGLDVNNSYYTQLPDYVYCISLNNTYINEKAAVKTLAHELAHYLGLLHVFSTDKCEETDFCNDTPTYNRTVYEEWIKSLTPPINMYDAVKRTDCANNTFISYNIMDYDYSYQNQFTADQFKRVRHVLENSPLIPGPKNVIFTKGIEDKPQPARFIE